MYHALMSRIEVRSSQARLGLCFMVVGGMMTDSDGRSNLWHIYAGPSNKVIIRSPTGATTTRIAQQQ